MIFLYIIFKSNFFSLFNSSQLATFEKLPQSEDFFLKLMPDNIVQTARLFLQYAPTTMQAAGEVANPILDRCGKLLDALIKPCPGLLEGVLLLARVKFLCNNLSACQVCIYIYIYIYIYLKHRYFV